MEKSEEKKLPENQPGPEKQGAPSPAARGKKALRRILKKGKRKLKRIKHRLVKATRLMSGSLSTKNAAAYGTPEEFEACVTAAMAETGWSRKEAEAQVRAAARKLKLRYVNYAKYHYCLIPPEEQARYRKVIRNVRNKHLTAHPEKKQKCPPPSLDPALIRTVVKETDWTREEAVAHFLNTYALTGSSLKEYVHYRMYDLDESAQQKVLNRLVNKKLCARYDTPALVHLLSYKEFTNSFFSEYFRRAWCVNTAVSLAEFSHRFQNCSRIIYKPIAGHRGYGVEAFDLNAANMESVYRTLSQYPKGVVEEYVRQHEELSRLNPDSVNTIRVVSFSSNSFPVTEDGKMMDIAFANVRIGGGGSIVDNFHSGGVTANIDLETGKIRTHAVDYEGKVHRKHPATGTVIKGFEIPYFQEALNMIRDAIRSRQLEGYIGWDVAIAEDGPLLIEINTMPGVGGLQTIYTPLKRGMKPLMAKYLAVDPYTWDQKDEAGEAADASDEAAGQAEADAQESAAPAALSPEEALKRQQKREAREKAACLKKTMSATGWSKEQALAHIEEARARLGVSYQDYQLTCLYGYSPEDQQAHYEAILAKRAARQREREKLYDGITGATGWTREQARARYRKAKARFGFSLEDYCAQELYLLEPERQMLHVRGLLEQAETEDRERAASLKLAMRVMRWSEEEAAAKLEESRAKLSVSYHDYRNLKLYRYELKEQERRYREYVEAREQEEKDRAACLKAVVGETGWARDYAMARIEEATKRLGVSYRDYRLMRLYRYAPEKQAEHRDKILAKRAREKAEKDKLVKAVAAASGWSFERAGQQMEKAEKDAGISYSNYLAARLYLYAPAEQEARYRAYLADQEKERRARAACLKAVREATGWTAGYAEAQVEDAKKRLGVSYQDYRLMKLFLYAPEKQAERRDAILARRAKLQAEKDACIEAVAAKTGWTGAEAAERIEQARKRFGVSFADYLKAELYRCADEEPETIRRALSRFRREQNELDAAAAVISRTMHCSRQEAAAHVEQSCREIGASPLEFRALRLHRLDPADRKAEYVSKRALWDPAREKISAFGPRTVEVTGSYGKTTTTGMIESMLSYKHRVYGHNNLNSNTVRWTLRRIAAFRGEEEFFLQESAEAPGYGVPGIISYMIQPDIAVVTSIGTSHIEIIGSQERIRESCFSVEFGMKPDGVLVLNADDPMMWGVSTEHRAVYYGVENEKADYRAVNVRSTSSGLAFDILHDGVSTPIVLNCVGSHNVLDAVASFAVGKLSGLSDEEAAEGLATFRTVGIRQNLTLLGGYRFFLDCYNASVEAMQSAVDAISTVALPEGGRRIAVLADIKEAGSKTEEYHRTVGKYLVDSTLDILICYGEAAQLIAEEASRKEQLQIYSAASHDEIVDLLRRIATPADIILLKGSHSMALECVVDRMIGTWFHDERIGEPHTPLSSEFFNMEKFTDHVVITKCSSPEDRIVLPALVCALPVVGLGPSSFEGTRAKEIVFCDTLRSIRAGAFKNAVSLTRISLPASVTLLDREAFANCVSLRSVSLSEGCLHIGDCAFRGCTGLERVIIPDSVRYIADSAFIDCAPPVFVCAPDSYAAAYAAAHGFSVTAPDEELTAQADYSHQIIPSLPEQPYMPKISSISKAGIEYYWKKPEIAEGYEIFRAYDENGPFEKIARLEKRGFGTYTDADFDHDKHTVYYTMRSYVLDSDGNCVYSGMLKPTAAHYRTELLLERSATYLYTDTQRTLHAYYGWGEPSEAIWSSDDERVASIDPDGTIRALSSGSCTVTCRCPEVGQSAVSRVVVDRKALDPLAEPTPRYHFDGQDGCWKQNRPSSERDGEAVIVMAGDMMCGSRQMTDQRTKDGGWDFNGSYDFIKAVNEKADFAIGNLETLLAAGWPYMTEETYIENANNCNAPSRYLDAVCHGGFDALALSNNHNCDGGREAVFETLAQIDRYRLARTGLFRGADEPRFLMAEINGIKVGFLAYCTQSTGYNWKDRTWSEEDRSVLLNTFSSARASRDIDACRAAGAEFVIVYMHWGLKNFRAFTAQQTREALAAANAGADYIVGSNPHLVQSFEMLRTDDGRSVPCCYSVGNFHSVMNQVPGNRDSALLRICLKRGTDGKILLADNTAIATHTCPTFNGRLWPILPLVETPDWILPEDAKTWLDMTGKALGEKISLVTSL